MLAGFASGRRRAILRDGHHVTLADIQRIRDLDAHLSGAFTVQPAEATELRQSLDADVIDGPSLVTRVRDV